MLLEHINHYHNLHFAIEFSNVAEEGPHYHRETEMALVLRGNTKYQIHHQSFQLNTGDIIVVDALDLHYIYDSSEDVILLLFYIDVEAFTDLHPNIDYMIFACEEFNQDAALRQQKLQNKIAFLSRHMAEMMALCQKENADDQQLKGKLQEILYMMVNQFQGFFIENNEFHSGQDDINPVDLDRLYRIIRYLYANYDQKVKLHDLAEIEHLSMYYISHLIKKTSGLSFQKLLNYIRVEFAEKHLNEDSLTLTQISERCGFSSPTYFNKCFQEWHGITPAQYRKQRRPRSRTFQNPFDQQEALSLLQPYLNTALPKEEDRNSFQSLQHIFIAVQPTYKKGREFHRAFPLHLLATSESELFQLVCHREEIARLNPASLTLTGPGLSSPAAKQMAQSLNRTGFRLTEERDHPSLPHHTTFAATAAEAFDCIAKEPGRKLRVSGSAASLFTPEGFPTPYYSLYRAFAGIGGYIGEQQEQYLLVQDHLRIFLILHHTAGDFKLNVHLQFNHGNVPDYIVRKAFGRNQGLPHIETITGPLTDAGPTLRSHIFDLACGSIQLLNTAESSGARVDVTAQPETLMILSFEKRL